MDTLDESRALERIARLEDCADRCASLSDRLVPDLDALDAAMDEIAALFAYYGSDDWFSDRELRLPPGTKAGILSEDLLYDRFTDLHALAARMRRSADALSAAIGPGTGDASA